MASWKGFQKGVGRTPQQLKQRLNRGEITKDSVYIDAERRFQDLEKETKRLHDESTKYFQAINGMLDHQIEFSQACEELYKPISGRASDPDSFVDDVGNPEGIRACEEYQALVHELKASLQPEIELIQTRIVQPAEELGEVVKNARKWATKRDHKQLDYDKAKNKLKSLQEKQEKKPTIGHEVMKAEDEVEAAWNMYTDFNEEVKAGFLQLFKMEKEFIQPLFQSFYYMQLNVFYTLHEKMQGMDIGYFDLTLGIEEAHAERRAEAQALVEAIPVVKWKTTGARKAPNSRFGGRLGIENGRSNSTSSKRLTGPTHDSEGKYIPPDKRIMSAEDSPGLDSPPPSYESANGDIGRSASTGSNWMSAAKGKAAPPPPKPKPGRLSGIPNAETVTALYDYEAQAEGDLSFSAGDRIEVVQRTDNTNEWWTGKIGARQGQFPGNYVELNS